MDRVASQPVGAFLAAILGIFLIIAVNDAPARVAATVDQARTAPEGW